MAGGGDGKMAGGGETAAAAHRIDGLQYAAWSGEVFSQMRAGGVDAVHATIAYHGGFREGVLAVEEWRRRLNEFAGQIFLGRTGADVRRARREGRTAIFFGFQNPSPIEDDLGLLDIFAQLGLRFMQLSYNNQSALAGGCGEREDAGVTNFGREAIAEMNRAGICVDMSHSGERSTLQAVELSARPVAVTHANPAWWCATARNKSDAVLAALSGGGGMLGLSLYPHHLRGGAACGLDAFCEMAGRTAEKYGAGFLGIGSDLCQGRADAEVAWMRNGRWRAVREEVKFPPPLPWFSDNRDFANLEAGLRKAGFSAEETAGILGENWLRFFDVVFGDGKQ